MIVSLGNSKFSCLKCQRGHRAHSCTHTARPLFEVYPGSDKEFADADMFSVGRVEKRLLTSSELCTLTIQPGGVPGSDTVMMPTTLVSVQDFDRGRLEPGRKRRPRVVNNNAATEGDGDGGGNGNAASGGGGGRRSSTTTSNSADLRHVLSSKSGTSTAGISGDATKMTYQDHHPLLSNANSQFYAPMDGGYVSSMLAGDFGQNSMMQLEAAMSIGQLDLGAHLRQQQQHQHPFLHPIIPTIPSSSNTSSQITTANNNIVGSDFFASLLTTSPHPTALSQSQLPPPPAQPPVLSSQSNLNPLSVPMTISQSSNDAANMFMSLVQPSSNTQQQRAQQSQTPFDPVLIERVLHQLNATNSSQTDASSTTRLGGPSQGQNEAHQQLASSLQLLLQQLRGGGSSDTTGGNIQGTGVTSPLASATATTTGATSSSTNTLVTPIGTMGGSSSAGAGAHLRFGGGGSNTTTGTIGPNPTTIISPTLSSSFMLIDEDDHHSHRSSSTTPSFGSSSRDYNSSLRASTNPLDQSTTTSSTSSSSALQPTPSSIINHQEELSPQEYQNLWTNLDHLQNTTVKTISNYLGDGASIDPSTVLVPIDSSNPISTTPPPPPTNPATITIQQQHQQHQQQQQQQHLLTTEYQQVLINRIMENVSRRFPNAETDEKEREEMLEVVALHLAAADMEMEARRRVANKGKSVE
ncbi:hypothetical protein HDU76_005455 [Blyttiomyces sp. JEL0837]|nr:hypothetical protein HDU76_005455 [Blyttiomyces sp. JEL0837]